MTHKQVSEEKIQNIETSDARSQPLAPIRLNYDGETVLPDDGKMNQDASRIGQSQSVASMSSDVAPGDEADHDEAKSSLSEVIGEQSDGSTVEPMRLDEAPTLQSKNVDGVHGESSSFELLKAEGRQDGDKNIDTGVSVDSSSDGDGSVSINILLICIYLFLK